MGIKLVPPLKHMKLKDVSVLQDLSNDDRELVKNPEISPSPSSYMKISVGRQCGVSKSFVFFHDGPQIKDSEAFVKMNPYYISYGLLIPHG